MDFKEEVKNQIGFPESNRLKYEALLPSSSEIARTVCAFANTSGGMLILGVLNKYNKLTVTGLSDDFRVEAVLSAAVSKLVPPPEIKSGTVWHEGRKLFIINVEKSNEPIAFNNAYYKIISKKITKVCLPELRADAPNKIESVMSNEAKLDLILNYLIDHPELINVNKYTVQKVILNDGTSLSESIQLIEKLRSTDYVRSYGAKYIGVSVNSEGFISRGGFSGTQRNGSVKNKKEEIFISYNWSHKKSAQKLYDFLELKGFSVSMDDHKLRYKDKLSTFMESIRSSDYTILLLSDEYLKSENCMAEVMHLLKERDFQEKILPVRHSNLKIFNTADRVKYITYWKSVVEEREALLSTLDITSAIEEAIKLKNIKKINHDIGDFLSEIADMITKKIEEEEDSSYEGIMEYIYRK